MSTAPLSKTGARMLAAAEDKIERGLGTFVEVGDALSTIRDGRLYREDYDTFEAYCQGRWGFTSRRARQLMEAAEIGTTVPISNEAQARPLAGLSPDEAIEVYEEAKSEGNVTAAGLKAARKRKNATQEGAGDDGPASEGDAGSRSEPTPETGPLDAAPSDGAGSHDVGRTEPESAPTANSGSDQSDAPGADAAGPGDDEQETTPVPSPAPKVAHRTFVTCPTCGGAGEIEAKETAA